MSTTELPNKGIFQESKALCKKVHYQNGFKTFLLPDGSEKMVRLDPLNCLVLQYEMGILKLESLGQSSVWRFYPVYWGVAE